MHILWSQILGRWWNNVFGFFWIFVFLTRHHNQKSLHNICSMTGWQDLPSRHGSLKYEWVEVGPSGLKACVFLVSAGKQRGAVGSLMAEAQENSNMPTCPLGMYGGPIWEQCWTGRAVPTQEWVGKRDQEFEVRLATFRLLFCFCLC